MNPEHDRILVEFFETNEGKAALTALMEFVGWNDMPQPTDVATANYQNGMKAVVARILLAYGRIANPAAVENQNPMGFR